MIRLVMHVLAVIAFAVACVFGNFDVESYSIEQLDMVAAGLALWAGSQLSK